MPPGLKRDLKKWEQKSERNSSIAKAAWGKRKDANAYERKQTKPDEADNVNVTVNVNGNVTVIDDEGVNTTSTPEFVNCVLLDTKTLNEKLYSDEGWIEATAMNLKSSITDVKNSIPEYITNLIASGKNKKTLQDAKSHFNNWYRKNKENGKSNGTTKEKPVAGRLTKSEIDRFDADTARLSEFIKSGGNDIRG